MKKLAIGIDIGGTNINAGLVNPAGKLLKSLSIPAKFVRDTKNIQTGIINLVHALKVPGIIGAGIGCPGRKRPSQIYKNRSRRTKNPPTAIIFSRLQKNKTKLEKKIQLPIIIENDASCFTLGEALFGTAKKYNIVAGITLGTGIGFGLIINKVIYRGGGSAQEFGHMIINFSDKNVYCQCRNKGCWEGYIGKKGIIRLAQHHGLKINEPKDLFELAEKDNLKAKKIWEEMGSILGTGLANIINGLSPEIIIIGGQIAKAWKFFNNSMQQEARQRSILKPCPIIKSKLKNSAVLGAASLILKPTRKLTNSLTR